MLSIDTLYRSLLLPAAGLLGMAAAQGSSHSPNAAGDDTAAANDRDRDRDRVRVRNSVRLIRSEEEGFPIHRLPDGVYGFSYSPATEALPLFSRHAVGAFELHKPAAGGPQILGYVTPQQAAAFAENQLQDVKFYPDPFGDARALVAIPSERIVRAKGPSRLEGNYLELTVR